MVSNPIYSPWRKNGSVLTNDIIGTVITCFPDTWKPKEKYNLKNVVKEQFNDPSRRKIESVESLFHLVLKTAIDFIHRKGPLDVVFKDAFQSSIDSAVCCHALILR
jgi:hypothetical protein